MKSYKINIIAILFSTMNCLASHTPPIGSMHFTGILNSIKIDTNIDTCAAALYSDDLELQFIDVKLGNMTFDGIEIKDIHSKNMFKVGSLNITNSPQRKNDIRVDFDVAPTCDDITVSSGIFKIISISKTKITGNIFMVISTTDSINCKFELPLYDFVPQLLLPPQKMDGTILKDIPLSDNFPNNNLRLGEIRLDGIVKGSQIENRIANGKITLSTIVLEIDAYDIPDLRKIEIEMQSEDIDNKIRVGKYNLINGIELENLNETDFLAEWEDYHKTNPRGEDSPIQGFLEITNYSKNGIAGTFSFTIIEKDKNNGQINGSFKLPIDYK